MPLPRFLASGVAFAFREIMSQVDPRAWRRAAARALGVYSPTAETRYGPESMGLRREVVCDWLPPPGTCLTVAVLAALACLAWG